MNKKLLSLLLLVLAAFTTATAQETLTVYDGTVSNGQVPAYLGYWDDFTRSQVVIPATDLTNMAGGTITSMTFYTTKQNLPYTSVSTADVYLMEVDYTAINAFVPKASATMVYQGTASFVLDETGEAGSWTIEFATPYIYDGGNLLIGIENTTDSGYKFIYFYGQTVEGASVAGYNSSSLDNVTATQKNFIPKTTFAYTPAGGVIVAKPTNLQVSNIGPNSATLSWTAGGEETAWDVEYKKAADEEWTQEAVTTPTLELDALENGTEYQVRVRANMGDGNVSGWVNTTFTTLLCDPEDMGEITYELKDSYGDGWSGNAIEIVAPNGLVVASLTITSGSTASGTVALCHGIEYTIRWKVGSYPGECSYTLTGPDGAEIVKGTGGTSNTTLTTYMLPAPGQGMVKNVEVTDITATTANVNWEGEQETYNVRYRTAGYPGGEIEGFEYGLASGEFPTESGWTTIDADGDGNSWYIFAPSDAIDGNGNPTVFDGACMTSASYMQNALTPDNWLISPQVELNGVLRMWLRGQDPGFAAEHFAVYVSTAGNTDVADFTTELIGETVAEGHYVEYTADLSAFEGQMGYIAIRHFNCTDQFRLNLDNFLIQDPEAVIEDGEWITAEAVTNPYALEGLTPNTKYEVQVQGNYEDRGTTEWTESVFFTTLEAPAPEKAYYLIGTFNEWDQENMIPFVEEDGVFTLTYNFGGEFKIKDEAGNWWGGGVTLTEENPSVTLVDGNNLNLAQVAEYTLTIEDGVLTVTGFPAPQPVEYSEFYVVGSFNGWKTEEGEGRVELTANEDATEFTGTVELAANDEFKIITPSVTGGWKWFGGQADGDFFLITNELLGGNIALVDGSNFKVEEGGEYTITVKAYPEDKGISEPLAMVITKNAPQGISTIGVDGYDNNAWYNLNGQKLNGKPTTPGIYINGHKKVVIK